MKNFVKIQSLNMHNMTCLHKFCVRKVTILPVVQKHQIKRYHPKKLLHSGDQVARRSFN